MKDCLSTVTENLKIADGVYMTTVALDEDCGEVHGGQFLNISTGDDSRLLRRPFGILKKQGREVSFCFQVKGEGTRALAAAKVGARLKVLLPLGNFFDLDGCKNIAVIGGGVGIFPLIATINEHYKDKNFYSYIGFRNKSASCLLYELEKSKSLKIVTDDGSLGGKGNAVQAFLSDIENLKIDTIIACGPPIMLRVLKNSLIERGIKTTCYVSLEERMGCGLGACLVCVCKKSDGQNARVCRDGPVFRVDEVEL